MSMLTEGLKAELPELFDLGRGVPGGRAVHTRAAGQPGAAVDPLVLVPVGHAVVAVAALGSTAMLRRAALR